MRLPLRVVGDYHVDRQEMYGQRCPQSTCTNSPRSFRPVFIYWCYLSQDIYCGGYSGGEPPLPIPNREVKPAIADGTAPPGGRVGSCRSSKVRLDDSSRTFLFTDVRGQVGRLPIQSFPGEGSNRFAPAPMFLLLRAGFGRFSARTGRFCLIRASFERFSAREGKSLSRLVRDTGEIGLSLGS